VQLLPVLKDFKHIAVQLLGWLQGGCQALLCGC